MTTEMFNNLIGQRNTLQEIQKLGIFKECSECRDKVTHQLSKIQDELEYACERGIIV